MKLSAVLAACTLLAPAAIARQASAPPVAATPPPGPIAMDRPETAARATITVRSTAFANGGLIPLRHAKLGDNISPPLSWRGAPARTQAYALIVDDPDGRLKPVNHWIIWNMRRTSLPAGIPAQPRTPAPLAARQGANTMKVPGWNGPKPPAGDPPHHYHFQVFALDAPLSLNGGAEREALLAAMRGHVLAKGDLIGLYQQPASPGARN